MKEFIKRSGLILAATLLFNSLQPAKLMASLSPTQIGDLAVEFTNSTASRSRAEILRQILQDNSFTAHVAFYALLTVCDEKSQPLFKAALSRYAQKELLGSLGSYMEIIFKRINSKYGNPQKLSPENLALAKKEAEETLEILGLQLEIMSEEISALASKNTPYLIGRLRKGYDSFEIGPMPFLGAGMALTFARENGFTDLLSNADPDKDGGMILMFMEGCPNQFAVIPAIKHYENPKSSKSSRLMAGVVLRKLKPSEPVFAKIAEAYRQDYYFEDDLDKQVKNGVLTIDKNSIGPMFDRVARNWKLVIEDVFKGNQDLVSYLGRNHLTPSAGRRGVIELMTHIHPATAARYLAKLDLETLDKLTTLAVVDIFMDKELNRCSADCKRDLFSIFNRTYGRVQKFNEHRSWMILSLDIFSQDQQETFIQKHFSGLDTGTKLLMVDRAASFDPERRKRMLAMMRKDPDKNVIAWIEGKK